MNAEFDVVAIERELGESGLRIMQLQSVADDRLTYLKRPDFGRRLSNASRELLQVHARECDVAIVIGDGLSPLATQRHASSVALKVINNLKHLNFGPISIVRNARVAVEDEIGEILRAKLVLMLLGERPGLGSADSLGAYIVYDPRVGNTDANRNCISNIRQEGLSFSLRRRRLLISFNKRLLGK